MDTNANDITALIGRAAEEAARRFCDLIEAGTSPTEAARLVVAEAAGFHPGAGNLVGAGMSAMGLVR